MSLNWKGLLLCMILMGHGHIFTAYYYQYRAGKMSAKGVTLFTLAAAVLVVSYYTFLGFNYLAILTGIYFVVHMLWDELYLLRMPMELARPAMHLGRTLELIPFILIYSARLIDSVLRPESLEFQEVSALMGKALILSGITMLVYVLLMLQRGYRPDFKSFYFLGWDLILMVAASLSLLPNIHAAQWIGIMVFYHYLIWYFHYFLTLPKGPPRRHYVTRIFVIHTILLLAFALIGSRGIGILFFNEVAFYIWTLLHLLTSTRRNDIRSLLRWPRAS